MCIRDRLFDCENQTAEKRQAEKFLGMDFAMHGMCVFSTGERAGYPMFYRNAEKKLAREQRKLSRCEKGSRNYQKQKKKVALYHEKIKNQRKDFQHKLSHSLAEDYDAVCVEDLNLKGIAGDVYKRQIESRQALKEAYRSAENANRAKTEFLSNMSHVLLCLDWLYLIDAAEVDKKGRINLCI